MKDKQHIREIFTDNNGKLVPDFNCRLDIIKAILNTNCFGVDSQLFCLDSLFGIGEGSCHKLFALPSHLEPTNSKATRYKAWTEIIGIVRSIPLDSTTQYPPLYHLAFGLNEKSATGLTS